MQKMIKRLALTAGLTLSSVTMAIASVGDRVALVIGNQNYAAADSLKNPINDSRAISAKLESMGFEVTLGTDLTYDGLRDTIRSFTREARDAEVTLFYYAGHGIAVDGKNYIVPVDAKLNDPFDWEFEDYDVAEILRLVDRAPGPSLIFLDACRDNPLAGVLAQAQGMSTRSLNHRGITRIPTETLGTSGTVIAYATEPGQVAADGAGDNSPFAEALIARLDTPGQDFASVTSLITGDVLEKTNGVQRPRFDVSLTGPLVLNPATVVEAAPEPKPDTPVVPHQTATPSTLQIEQVMFEAALASNDIADFEVFLNTFPNSAFAPMAKNAVARLEAEKKSTEQVAMVQETPSVTRLISMPLTLSLTPNVKAMMSNEATDRALGLDRTQRKEVQLRLNLAGFDVGRPDGAIGPNSRRGISSWQVAHGFAGTGYLNNVQHQYLVANTDQAFTAHMAANPNALSTPAPARQSASRPSNNKVPDFLKGAAAGAAAIMLLKK